MKISIRPIRLDINDSHKYRIVARFVDQIQFLVDLELARKRLAKKGMNLVDNLLDYNKVKELDYKPLSDVQFFIWTEVSREVVRIRRRYFQDENCTSIIESALLCGIVTEKEVSSFTYSLNLNSKVATLFNKPAKAIFITNLSSLEDIKEQALSLGLNLSKGRQGRQRMPDEIHTQRVLYFRNLGGESPRDIAISHNGGFNYYQQVQEQCRHFGDLDTQKQDQYGRYLADIDRYEDKVEKAINSYKKFLSEKHKNF